MGLTSGVAERTTVPHSNRKALVRRRMEHLLRRDLAGGQPLRMGVAQEGLKDLAVGGEPVGPEIVSHQLARGPELLFHQRQRAFGGPRVLELVQAPRLAL